MDSSHRWWEQKLVQQIENYVDIGKNYPQIKLEAIKKGLAFLIDDLKEQIEREKNEMKRKLGKMQMDDYVPLRAVQNPPNIEGEVGE